MGNGKNRVCRYFGTAEGCKFGNKCRFSHATEGPSSPRSPSSPASTRAALPIASTSAAARSDDRRPNINESGAFTYTKQAPCRFFLQGHCFKGEQCQWSHEYKTQEDIMKKEAETTVQRVVFEETSLVTCGAGMQVQDIVCGFNCCYVTIKNLPQDTKRAEIEELFIQQGLGVARFYVVKMRSWNSKVEAKVFVDADVGETLATGLDGTAFRDETLDIAIDHDAGPSKMGSSARNANVLTVSWKPPSATRKFLVRCNYPWDAPLIIRKLHNTVHHGRRIQAESQGLNYVKVSGLPKGTTLDWEEILGADYNITNVTACSLIDSEAVERNLKRTVAEIVGYQTCDVSPPNPSRDNTEARIQFDSWENAKRGHDQLLRPLGLGYPRLNLWLPKPNEYFIKIPVAQYRAQQARWDSLSERDDNRAAYITVKNISDQTSIRVLGEDKKAVGQLKVRVESLIAGEILDAALWHRSFLGKPGQRILDEISTESRAYIRCDWKTKSLKIYADGRAKEDALNLLKERVNNLNESEFSISINRGAVRFFTSKGLDVLKNELGDDAATLELIPSPRLVVRGGEEARRVVDRLLEESRTGFQLYAKSGEDTCPVCFDEPSSPILLGCKHVYCTECIRHFLTSASERKQFPLVCAGDDAKCRAPIAIPIIQRFLSQQQFNELLEAAVASYIEKQPEQFQYCTTADCKQVYRRGSSANTCPSCLASVCIICNKEAHEGMTCRERELLDDPVEQERRNEQWALTAGVKRCPRCRVFVQKTEGCNHMTCRCGVHFCWICLLVTDPDSIYRHMRTEHGGIDTPDVPRPIQVNDPLRANQRIQVIQPARANDQIQADFEYAQRLQREEILGDGHVEIDNVGVRQAARLEQLRRARAMFEEARRTQEEATQRRLAENAEQAREAIRRVEEARRAAERRTQEVMQRRQAQEVMQRRQTMAQRAADAQRRREDRGSWCIIM